MKITNVARNVNYLNRDCLYKNNLVSPYSCNLYLYAQGTRPPIKKYKLTSFKIKLQKQFKTFGQCKISLFI